MLNWNDIILSLLGKANSKGKQLYIEIIDDDGGSELLYFDKINESDEALSMQFTRKRKKKEV